MGEVRKGFIATIKMNFMQNELCISNDADLNFRQKSARFTKQLTDLYGLGKNKILKNKVLKFYRVQKKKVN